MEIVKVVTDLRKNLSEEEIEEKVLEILKDMERQELHYQINAMQKLVVQFLIEDVKLFFLKEAYRLQEKGNASKELLLASKTELNARKKEVEMARKELNKVCAEFLIEKLGLEEWTKLIVDGNLDKVQIKTASQATVFYDYFVNDVVSNQNKATADEWVIREMVRGITKEEYASIIESIKGEANEKEKQILQSFAMYKGFYVDFEGGQDSVGSSHPAFIEIMKSYNVQPSIMKEVILYLDEIKDLKFDAETAREISLHLAYRCQIGEDEPKLITKARVIKAAGQKFYQAIRRNFKRI